MSRMSWTRMKLKLQLLVLALCALSCRSKVIEQTFSGETRDVFSIEEFGIVKGGFINVTVRNFENSNTDKSQFVGLVVSKTTSIGSALELIRKEKDSYTEGASGYCPYPIQENQMNSLYFQLINCSLPDQCKDFSWSHSVKEKDMEGLYSVIFVSCTKATTTPVSFELYSTMYNQGPTYLSAGDAPVPTILFIFTIIFGIMLGLWVHHLRHHPSTIHHVHHMMTVLLLLKVLALFSRAVDLHYLKVTGSAIGWNLIYYFFVTLKGISFFTVLLMIGSGWSLLKPTLNDKEMKILLFVLPLQLFANIALIVEDERAKGSQGWFRWRDLFLIVDFLCAVAVILPVIWQINFLKQAANVDGKAQANLSKLKQFQKFYIQMVAYIYFTRIILFLLGTTLPFYQLYWKAVLRESATAIFYTLTGYRFRPAADNPYLRVRTEDDEAESRKFFDEIDNDFGLGDDYAGEQELVPPNKNIRSMNVI